MKLFAAILCITLSSLYAQTLTQSRTDMYYDSTSNTVYQISSATVDYSSEYWYDLRITSYLRRNGTTWSFSVGNSNGTSYASTYGSAIADTGQYYDTYSYADLITQYLTYQVDPGCPTCYDFYDPFDYSFIERTGDPNGWGPTWSVWVWAPPIITARISSNTIQLGATGAGAQSVVPYLPNVFDVKLRSFIRPTWVWGPDTCTSFPYVLQTIYHGDGRNSAPYSWNVRTHSEVMVNPSQGPPAAAYHFTGVSKRYASDALQPNGTLLGDSVLNDCHLLDNAGSAPINDMHADVSGSPPTSYVHMYGSAANPVAWGINTPTINWDFATTISVANPVAPTFNITFIHDCYPAFEMYINNQPTYVRYPVDDNTSTITACLYGVGPYFGTTSGTLFKTF